MSLNGQIFPLRKTFWKPWGGDAVDVGLVGDGPFQFAYQSGSPARAVAAMQAAPAGPGALAVVVNGRSPAHTVSDLVGKRVATTRGSIGHYLILRALADAGLRPDAVKLVFLSPADAKAALQTGAIDAWSSWVPYTAAALAEGARIVVDGRKYSQGVAFDVASAGAIAHKRALLADFLEREARALAWSNTHGADYARILAAETGLPPAIAAATVRLNGRQRTAIDPDLIARQQVILNTFRNAGEFKSPRPIQDAFVPV